MINETPRPMWRVVETQQGYRKAGGAGPLSTALQWLWAVSGELKAQGAHARFEDLEAATAAVLAFKSATLPIYAGDSDEPVTVISLERV